MVGLYRLRQPAGNMMPYTHHRGVALTFRSAGWDGGLMPT